MTVTPGKRQMVLAGLPLVLAPLVFVAAKPWLKTMLGAATINLVAAAFAIFEMGYALYLSVRWQRCVDEVQAASSNFAARWGMTAGSIAFVILMLLPPFVDLAAAAIADMFDAPSDHRTVKFAMLAGFGGVVILQTAAMFVINLFWWRSHR